MSILLETKNLSAQYGKVLAVQNINLQVKSGQVVTVIGANGAGKSTLLNSIMGSLPVPGSANGEVLYQEHDVSRLIVEDRVANGLCLVPEKRELFSSMPVEDNLLLGGFRRYRSREKNWRSTLDEVY